MRHAPQVLTIEGDSSGDARGARLDPGVSMEWLGTGDYDVARQILQRGVAALYVVAFLNVVAQFRPLLGAHGLLPAPRYIARTSGKRAPSIFRRHYSDSFVLLVAWCGVTLALTVVTGWAQSGPPWVPLVVFLVLWVAYLSVVNIGQTFYAFGWESLLLEAGFLVAFLGSDDSAAPVTVLVLARWLVFRLELGAGLIKMRGDTAWRDLTALDYHHETQPIPGPFSWHAHHLPRWWHRTEVVGNHVTQLVVPFLLFAPQPVASVAAAVVVLTQAWLVATGNFAWLNALTMVLACAAISDDVWDAVLPGDLAGASGGGAQGMPVSFGVVVLAVSALLAVLSYRPARNLVSRDQLMNASFDRWRLVNAYGAFGSITRRRQEVVVEGTLAEDPTEEDWVEYPFKGKPGDPSRRPRQLAPYHLRLDWLMWFLALGSPDDRWFRALLLRLLEADRPTLRLLAHDPFDGRPPRYVRARVLDYRYTTRAERHETGDWWVRTSAGTLVRPVRQAKPPT